MQTSNNHICIIPQVESVAGVAAIEEIAAVPGISALMFGPGDYRIDAGLDISNTFGGEQEPEFLDAIGKFYAAAKKNNLPIFGAVWTVDNIPMVIQQGFRAICVQFDVWGLTRLLDSSLKTAKGYREELGGKTNGNVSNGHVKRK